MRWLVVIALFAACSSETRIRVTIDGASSIQSDGYQIKVEDRLGVAQPLSTLELIVPDSMAGHEAKVELWALRAGSQVGYAGGTVTPSKGSTVDVAVAMNALTCGLWCEPGTTRCAADAGIDGTQMCGEAADGCTSFGAPAACAAATPYCSNGTCAASCSDECSTGAHECDGAAAVRQCGQHDNDTCLDWSASTACDAGQTCSGGSCSSSQTCTSGEPCDDGNACTDNDTCDGNVCSGDAMCADRAPECQNSTTLRLYGLGATCTSPQAGCMYSYNDATCTLGCANDACAVPVASGGNNSCGLEADGTLICWGDMANSTLPTAKLASIDVDEYHGCGMTTAGAAVCWQRQTFDNFYGEATVPPGSFKAVAVAQTFSCGIHTDGTLECWGDSTGGRLDVPTGTFVAVSAGTDHSCAIRTEGTAACWGNSATTIGGSFTHIAAGNQFSCGIHPGGVLECWGTIAAPPPGAYIALSAGYDHACAVRSDGLAKCWGSDASGKSTPISATYTSISAGDQHTCGARANGTLVCWGDTSKGATVVPAGL